MIKLVHYLRNTALLMVLALTFAAALTLCGTYFGLAALAWALPATLVGIGTGYVGGMITIVGVAFAAFVMRRPNICLSGQTVTATLSARDPEVSRVLAETQDAGERRSYLTDLLEKTSPKKTVAFALASKGEETGPFHIFFRDEAAMVEFKLRNPDLFDVR